jgi:monovalent cation:H+ antiporter-2, CPA2 family
VAHEAEGVVEPLKYMFTAVFFVSIGMLIQPMELVDNWAVILGISLVIAVVRIIGIAAPAFLFGFPPGSAMRGGAALGQVGEFSFIVLASGIAAGLIGTEILSLFVGVAGVTTLMTPYLIMLSPWLLKGMRTVTPAPLLTYAQYYTTWVQRLGEEEETKRHRRREAVLLRKIVLNSTALFALGAVGYLVILVFADQIIQLGQWSVPLSWFVIPVVGVVMLPFVVTLWAALRELGMEMIYELVPDRVAMQSEPPVALRVVRASLGFVLALGAGGVVLLLLPDTGPLTLAGGGMVALVVVIAAMLLWRQIVRLHDQVEVTMEDLFGVAKTREERDEVMRLIGRHYTVSLETLSVQVPAASPLAHRQLRDTQMRNRTGATVVSVKRDRDQWVNPPPSLLILPGDELLLIGEPDHLERARRFVSTQAQSPEPPERPSLGEVTVQEHELHSDSAACGHTISGIGLRERTGASIVAVLRDHTHIQNPPPNLVLAPQDRVFLIGTKQQVSDAVALLSRSGPPSGRGAVSRSLGDQDDRGRDEPPPRA